jgi:hypothetical protein
MTASATLLIFRNDTASSPCCFAHVPATTIRRAVVRHPTCFAALAEFSISILFYTIPKAVIQKRRARDIGNYAKKL